MVTADLLPEVEESQTRSKGWAGRYPPEIPSQVHGVCNPVSILRKDICACVYTCVCTCIYVYGCIGYTCMCTYVCVHVSTVCMCAYMWASLVAQTVKNLPAMWETRV